MRQSALLLIEFQNEWLDEKGKLNKLFLDKEQFVTSVNNAKKVISAARQVPISIIHSGLGYTETYSELGKAKHGLRAAIPIHKMFLAGSFASQFPQPFQPQAGEFVVQGRVGGSVFSGSNLDAYLRNNHIHTLYLMGYALHVCVESTLRAAHDLGYEVVVIEDACSAFNQEQKNYFLTSIMHHFSDSMTSSDFITLLNR